MGNKLQKILVICIYLGVISSAFSQENRLNRYLEEIKEAEEQTDVAKACIAYKNAIAFCRETPQVEQELPFLLFRYGSILSYSGEYNKAIEVLKEALKINESSQTKDNLLTARIYMQFGILHFFQKHWEEALYFYRKAERKALLLKNKQGISIASNNIANVYQKKGDYKQAISTYKKSLEIQEQIQDTATICNTLFNIGTCYEELGQSQKALSYFSKSYRFATAINDAEIVPLSLTHQAILLTKNNEYLKAQKLLENAEIKAKKTGYKQVLAEIYKIKTTFYEHKDDYKNALKEYKKYQSLSSVMLNEKLEVETKSLELKLKSKEKEQKIIRQKDKIANQKLFLWLLGVSSFLGLFFTVTIYWLWKNRKKQNQKLVQLNNTKDKLFHIISHDLMAPAIGQKKAITQLKAQVTTLNNKTIKNYCDMLYENTENQFNIVESLINWAKIQTKTIKSNPYALDIIPVIQKEIALYKVSAKQKDIIISSYLPETCISFIDKDMFAIIIRNLINNAVKFTEVGGKVIVSCVEQNDKIIIYVKDNGVGMTEQQIKSFYDSSEKTKINFGTKGEKGTGLGLILCQELLEYSNSKLVIESKENEGTKVQFSIKKIKDDRKM